MTKKVYMKPELQVTQIHTIQMLATSVQTCIPVCSLTFFSHFRPWTPTPSKLPGIVRGFQRPALKTFTPIALRARAVSSVCCSVSALHGPAMMMGEPSSTPFNLKAWVSCNVFIQYL